ncbi:MAG: hypothetical protein ABJH72_06045 [Reichenbachiella sp.]|uniref:hypothetical protein n=1 Tax=Reichenbachiella sp. TaxID=2184521 RepID=UPI00329827AF
MKAEIETKDIPFFKLSSNQDLLLFLIKKELQGTKFTKELDRIGFDHSLFCIDLGVVILSLMGFENRSDDLWGWYYRIMDSYADKVDLYDTRTAHELALDFYLELRTQLRSG